MTLQTSAADPAEAETKSSPDTQDTTEKDDIPKVIHEKDSDDQNGEAGDEAKDGAKTQPTPAALSIDTQTPRTGSTSSSPAPAGSRSRDEGKRPSTGMSGADADFDLGHQSDGNAVGAGSTEISTIMQQFEGANVPEEDEIMTPRMELASSNITSSLIRRTSLDKRMSAAEPTPVAPPKRTSSLPSTEKDPEPAESKEKAPSSPIKQAPPPPPPQPTPSATATAPATSTASTPPPPDPPFDFNRFLEQLRHRSAVPVAKYVRSFLQEFGKKQWMVHEQVKIISDFLEFIAIKMAQTDVWRRTTDAEFDNAREGMEKLIMNRLHDQTFSPRIPSQETVAAAESRRSGGRPVRVYRRGQHHEDVERDTVLGQKVLIYSWVKESHLDINPIQTPEDKAFLKRAQDELSKINDYRAPRDKVICILNCCKVIFGLLRKVQGDQSADSFIPFLIYVILRANPAHLVSNVQYILRFRNQDKLGGETGYYISSLMGSIQFIENIDRTYLTISDAEFEQNVEAAVSAIAERDRTSAELNIDEKSADGAGAAGSGSHPTGPSASSSATPIQLLGTAAPSATNTPTKIETPGPSLSDDIPTVAAGILRSIQRPLTTIGKIFSDDSAASEPAKPIEPAEPAARTEKDKSGGGSGQAEKDRSGADNADGTDASTTTTTKTTTTNPDGSTTTTVHIPHTAALTAAEQQARMLSVEEAEARNILARELAVVADTLAGMFPALDREVIDDVVREKQGQVGPAVDACLALSND